MLLLFFFFFYDSVLSIFESKAAHVKKKKNGAGVNCKGRIIKSLQIANLLVFSPNFDFWCVIIVTPIFKNK